MSVSWLDVIRFKLGLHQTKVGAEDWNSVLEKLEAQEKASQAHEWKSKVLQAETEVEEALWEGTLSRMPRRKIQPSLLYGTLAMVAVIGISFVGGIWYAGIRQEKPEVPQAAPRIIPYEQPMTPPATASSGEHNRDILKESRETGKYQASTLRQETDFPLQAPTGTIPERTLQEMVQQLSTELPAETQELQEPALENKPVPEIQESQQETAASPGKQPEVPLEKEALPVPDRVAAADSAVVIRPDAPPKELKKRSGKGWSFLAEAGVIGSRWQNTPSRAAENFKGDSVQESRTPYYQFSPGLQAGVAWNNWELKTGAQYAQLRLSGIYEFRRLVCDSIPFIDTAGKILFYTYSNYRDSIYKARYNGTTSYWMVPLEVHYNFVLNEKTRLNAGVGVVLGFAGKLPEGITGPGGSQLKRVNWNYMGNLSIERQLKGPFSLSAGMYYQHQPESIFNNGSTLRSAFSHSGMQVKLKYSIPLQRKPHDP